MAAIDQAIERLAAQLGDPSLSDYDIQKIKERIASLRDLA